MKPKSLRMRSLLTVVAVVIPCLVGGVFVSYSHISYQLTQRFDGRMDRELHMLEAAVLQSAGDDARLRELVELVPTDTFPRRRPFGVWADGLPVLATDDLPFARPPGEEPGFATVEAGDVEWRTDSAIMPPSAATRQRRILLIVADPMATRSELIQGAVEDVIVPLLVAVPFMIIGIYVALVQSLKPLLQLAEQIRRRSAEQLQPVCVDSVPSEAAPIAESVNNLLARISESLERERRFTADAAHELRTPLTALKAHAQVALAARDEQLRRDTLQNIVRTVNRTDRMIAQLLTLARLDPEARQMCSDRVDLTRVVSQTLSELNMTAEGRGQTLRLEAQDGVMVRGNAVALGILTRNIVENAIHYSDNGAPIDVQVSGRGACGVLEVRDRGPGIPDEEKQEVFRRFRRMPGAKAPGTGLGLSIVQRIADLHGGQIALQDGEGGVGMVVTARIPVAA